MMFPAYIVSSKLNLYNQKWKINGKINIHKLHN